MTETRSTGHESTSTQDDRRWWGLAAALLAVFMGNVDVFIVNVAAPAMQSDLTAGFADVQLVIAGYVLAYAVGLVTGGRLGDRWGRKHVFLIGLAGFVVFSAACAAAPTTAVLIGVRVGQGLAAALMLPQVLALIQVGFNNSERPLALSLYGAVLGLGSVAGLLLGGVLLAANPAGLTWRTIFLVNIPVGLVALVLAAVALGSTRPNPAARADLPGAVLLGLGLLGLLYPLLRVETTGWSASTGSLLVSGALVIALFLTWERHVERRSGEPLLAPRLFRQPGFCLGLPAILTFYTGNAGLYLTLTYFLQDGLGGTPLRAGLSFLPMGVGFALASLISNRLVQGYGPRVLPLAATTMGLAAAVAIPLVPMATPNSTPWPLLAALAVYGLGGGIVAAPVIGHVLATVDSKDAGVASGALLTTQQAANAVGIATIGTLFTLVLAAHTGLPGYDRAFGTALGAVTVTAALTVSLLALLHRFRRR